jgi:hypothetical protein
VEEGAILVVLERVIDLLVPDDASVGGRDVNQFDPEGVSDQIVGEHSCSLQARIGPFVAIRVGDVEACDGDSLDLVRRFGHCPFDRLFIRLGEHGRHRRRSSWGWLKER